MLTVEPDARPAVEVLIPEARRRQRRRRLAIGVVLVVLASALVGYQVDRSQSPSPVPPAASPPLGSAAVAPAVARTLTQPATLAIGVDGVLYVADDTRNMIFARHRDGRFTVVAGDGRSGDSGNGGPATMASLDHPAGMVYERATHTLYFADTGNGEVRAINSAGVITTVAGGGPKGWVTSGTRASDADLFGVSAITVSRSGRLFIADALEVLRLNPSGTLTRIAGRRHRAGIAGIGGPATDAATDSADGLAFDRAGDLYLTGSATKGLLAITPDGRMLVISRYSVYPRGNAGIVTDPDGGVIVMEPTRIERYRSLHSHTTLVNLGHLGTIGGVRDVSPAGIAVTRSGTIYIDTDNRAGYSSETALIVVSRSGGFGRVLWRRH